MKFFSFFCLLFFDLCYIKEHCGAEYTVRTAGEKIRDLIRNVGMFYKKIKPVNFFNLTNRGR